MTTSRICCTCACAWDGADGSACWNCGSTSSTFYYWPTAVEPGSDMPRESWSLEELAA